MASVSEGIEAAPQGPKRTLMISDKRRCLSPEVAVVLKMALIVAALNGSGIVLIADRAPKPPERWTLSLAACKLHSMARKGCFCFPRCGVYGRLEHGGGLVVRDSCERGRSSSGRSLYSRQYDTAVVVITCTSRIPDDTEWQLNLKTTAVHSDFTDDKWCRYSSRWPLAAIDGTLPRSLPACEAVDRVLSLLLLR